MFNPISTLSHKLYVALFIFSYVLLSNQASSHSSSGHASELSNKQTQRSIHSTQYTLQGYYVPGSNPITDYPLDKLTHLIYSFVYLGNDGKVSFVPPSETRKIPSRKMAEDSEKAIHKLVELKKTHPKLKIMIALGGWVGCPNCSEGFSTKEKIEVFAASTADFMNKYKLDGIDLDWEYPAIPGQENQQYKKEDKQNFSLLIKTLRKHIGKEKELSFAAGGFKRYFDESVEWNVIEPYVDRVNIMSYDLVNGFSKSTGHHTPLYSTDKQQDSADFAVQYLKNLGFPTSKLVLGSAFYGRIWEKVGRVNHGLYQKGTFQGAINFNELTDYKRVNEGYRDAYDDLAQAAYSYNADKKLYLTYENKKSARAKARYVVRESLNGIMFWRLQGDFPNNGLIKAIHDGMMQEEESKNIKR